MNGQINRVALGTLFLTLGALFMVSQLAPPAGAAGAQVTLRSGRAAAGTTETLCFDVDLRDADRDVTLTALELQFPPLWSITCADTSATAADGQPIDLACSSFGLADGLSPAMVRVTAPGAAAERVTPPASFVVPPDSAAAAGSAAAAAPLPGLPAGGMISLCVNATAPRSAAGDLDVAWTLNDTAGARVSGPVASPDAILPASPARSETPPPLAPNSPPAIDLYCLPFLETDLETVLEATNTANGYGQADLTATHVEVGIASASDGTVIYWDHHEDGFEADPDQPQQASSQVWGDGIAANGCAPGAACSDASDVLDAGAVVSLIDDVWVDPADPDAVPFDGGDCFAVSAPVGVVRAGWADNGTVHTGAVEVAPVASWGNTYRIPIGNNLAVGEQYEFVAFSVMSATDGNSCEIDADNDGVSDGPAVVLDQGSSHLVLDVALGASVTCSAPVQVHTVSGDIDADGGWETRFHTQVPFADWASTYQAPLGSFAYRDANNDGNWCGGAASERFYWYDMSSVLLFNPSASSALQVDVATAGGSTLLTVPAGGAATYALPLNGGATFTSRNGAPFFATLSVNANEPEYSYVSCTSRGNAYYTGGTSSYDWGAALQPATDNRSDYVVPMGYSYYAPDPTGGGRDCGSTVFAMADTPLSLYVDFDQDGTADAPYNPLSLAAYESAALFDAGDHDMTGAYLYTADDTPFSIAWGLNPACALTGHPYLDMGTSILPLPAAWYDAQMTAEIVNDNDNGVVNCGETVAYTLAVSSKGMTSVTNLVAGVTLPAGAEYQEGTTLLSVDGGSGWAPVADDQYGTPFPLDEAGFGVGILAPGAQALLRFAVVVSEPGCGGSPLVCSASIASDNAGSTQPAVGLDTAPPGPTAVSWQGSGARSLFSSPLFQGGLLVGVLAIFLVVIGRGVLRLRLRRHSY